MFLSSHLMSEMAQTADHLIVIGRGRIIADTSTDEFINQNASAGVRVRAIEQTELADAVKQSGGGVESRADGALLVTGLDCIAVGGHRLRERHHPVRARRARSVARGGVLRLDPR